MLNMELLMQYVSCALMIVGVLAFLVAAVVQAVKELPLLQRIPTSVVALAVSLAMCMAAMVVACQYLNVVITWYYVFAAFIAAFIVYLVATGGWERIAEMWSRTGYHKKQ